ncbi:2',3'-cyclic-nucleotide 2'-phosphodiesterase/3'-nucleotidase/5'-nucleotidase [Bacillus ectoiniformans]|uniref:5'-nucleotidase C-terminal domain-containing protein n=1 Tax=Bacillus ectoiniformans TaxID=1494429 RepID=UPI00195841A8|nr:5'-nucleotidase C-terminal domain-containing protein [Bacillus ectoiniformans]MBM7649297.1 2',3'-cyclic-nucleotide 2'-phosphodiesterase/3'-nucleotidase/5'-nucleotidase [Bacillus ectoiniformans]
MSNYSKKLFVTAVVAAMATGSIASLPAEAKKPEVKNPNKPVFKDVKEDAHYYEGLKSLHERGVIKGYGDEFRPNQEVTRAQAAKIMVLALGLDTKNVPDPGFKDVTKDHWAYSYIAALTQAGIVSGNNGQFNPDAPLSRAQIAKMITHAFSFEKGELTDVRFTDVDKDAWYAEFLKPLMEMGITTGTTPTTFSPNKKVTRGQIISFIVRSEKAKQKPDIEESFELSVLHTNDTHAHIDNAARKVTAIKEARAEKPNALLLDAGDVFSGTLYFNEFKGQADLEFMNLVKYDAMTLGNHEFDMGTETLAAFIKNAKFPLVSANVDGSQDAYLKDLISPEISAAPEDGKLYDGIIKEVDGEKIGIFGLTTAETKIISSPGEDVVFEDYLAESQKAVAEFEKQGVDKIIALTHIGFKDGGGDNDVTLAQKVEGIDVIVGGHSHDQLAEPFVETTGEEPTIIVQANEYNKYLGTLDVEFDKDGKVVGHAGQLIDIDAKNEDGTYKLKEDAEAAKILNDKYKPKIDEVKQTVVGQTDVVLDGERANVRTKETNLGNLITDGMLAKAKTIDSDTVIALQNGGGIRASIDEGEVTMDEVLTVMPFGNSLAIMDLTGAEIKAALEHSVSQAPEQSGAFLQVAGLKFAYDATQSAGERVVTVEVKEDGETFTELDLNKTYAVATNTFTAKGGDGYTMFKNAYDSGRVSEPGFVDWEIFSDYLKANPGAIPSVEGRILDGR